MYSLSAFFILSSRAPPSTSAAAFITPPGDNDQPEEDIIKTLDHKKYMVIDKKNLEVMISLKKILSKHFIKKKYMVEYNRSFI